MKWFKILKIKDQKLNPTEGKLYVRLESMKG